MTPTPDARRIYAWLLWNNGWVRNGCGVPHCAHGFYATSQVGLDQMVDRHRVRKHIELRAHSTFVR